MRDTTELLASAWRAHARAYAPYSRFQVGAALAIEKAGTVHIVSGCNVENATYGATICAERSAIVQAVNAGLLPEGTLLDVVVATTPSEPSFTPPCGICRQILQEFSQSPVDTKVHLSIKANIIGKTYTLADLFPFPFDKDNL